MTASPPPSDSPESPKPFSAGRVRLRIGEMLRSAGLITEDVLKTYLDKQRHTKEKLGRLLVQDGIVTEEDLLLTMSYQLGVEMFDEIAHPFDPSLADVLPQDLAKKLRIAPVKRQNRLLLVCMADPTDLLALDRVTEVTRLDVEPVLCREVDLNRLLGDLYGRDEHDAPKAESELDAYEDQTAEIETEKKDETLDLSYSLRSMAEEAPVVKLVNSILLRALSKNASDIHINPEADSIQLRCRIDGVLVNLPAPPKSYMPAIASRIKLISNMDISVSRIPQDGRFSFRAQDRDVSVRASSLPTIYGEKIVLRLLVQSGQGLSLEQLGLAPEDQAKIERAVDKDHGMILATGPTGSGKTTMLYALLRRLNNADVNIVTLEDPVEYKMKGTAQAQLNRKAGMTFATGLRSILRQDPDVIMVGEIRDAETAHIAVEAALTGHRLLSTLHTNDAPGAVTRFIEMGVEPFLVASTLLVAAAQRLARRLCPECRVAYVPTEAERALFPLPIPENARFYRGGSCKNCGPKGYKGRVGVYEFLEIDPEIQDLIVKRATGHEIKRAAVASGRLTTLAADAASKTLRGLTSFEEFVKVGFV